MSPRTALPALAALALSVVGSTPVLPAPVQHYLQVLGYLPAAPALSLNGPDVTDAIMQVQREFGLPLTGGLDNQTLMVMGRPRCGVSPGFAGRARRSRRFLSLGSRWRKAVVTYSVTQYPSTLSRARVDQALARAVAAVANASRLQLAQAPSTHSHADIEVRFVDDDHGCIASMTDPVLAHAFGPIDGSDVHIRSSLNWSRNNVDIILAHELLHAVGLDHSMLPEALMFPSYHDLDEFDPLFHRDDVDGLQLLYGRPGP